MNFLLDLYKKIKYNQDYKRLSSNIFSLSFSQFLAYLIPLITLPYIVRVLGPEKFGLVSFAQAFISYFLIIVDYGFNMSATRSVSINRNDNSKLSEIFSAVILIKILFFIISFIILSIIIFIFDKFKYDFLLYYLTFITVLAQTLSIGWLFYGLEDITISVKINIISKIFNLIFIFLLIKKEDDYLYLPTISSILSFISSIVLIFIAFRKYKISFKVVSFKDIFYHLKEGLYIFVSNIAISLYTISNTFILGLFTNNIVVGYYSGAERIIKAVLGLYNPVFQSIYPYISNLANNSKEKAIKFIKKILYIIAPISFIMSLSIFVFSKVIISLFLGNQYDNSILVLKIISFLPFIVVLSNIFLVQGLVGFGYRDIFMKVTLYSSFLGLIFSSILIYYFKEIGAGIASLFSEIIVTLLSIYYAKRFKIL